MSVESRKLCLEELLTYKKDIETLRINLSNFDWDSGEDLVTLKPSHIKVVLSRFAANEMSSSDIYEWANLIEFRDDVGFDPVSEDKVKALIFELANPEITNELSIERANEIIQQL